jgi:aminopeptidase N
MTSSSEHTLTREEAARRAALLEVDRYDIEVDMRGLLAGDTVRSVSRIRFRCAEPGAATFVDCAADVQSATLNGRPLELPTDDRIVLTDLAPENVLEVVASQSDTASGNGILRSVDPKDGLVYVWTSFEPDEARRVWACFDQPDLKAPHAFRVLAPAEWTVCSNGAPTSVEPVTAGDDEREGTDLGRLWTFPDTPPLSTYVVVVNAGPFHEVREQRGDHSLGLYCRQSLRPCLERDATELLDLTEAGLAFFGDRFGQAFPQERYDQVFVPNMGGAMENWGCVTWTDAELFRSTPTHAQREYRAIVLLHEMAHMWFGDLVTMSWWDDLWLNEAFASWAAAWAAVNASEFTEYWATNLATEKIAGYRADMGPATHPIRSAAGTVAEAMATFDEITYMKGLAVLRQLAEYVGEDAFVAGLRTYFRDHAWGNTTLDDLMSAVGSAAGRDLGPWTAAWLDRAGTDTITLTGGALVATAPDGGAPRPHRLDVGAYRRSGDGLERVARVEVETADGRTPLDLPDADLVLVNDEDLTFAAVRTDEASLRTLLETAPLLPSTISRTLAVATAWDMLVKGELAPGDTLDCLLGVLRSERSAGVIGPFLDLALSVAQRWTNPVAAPAALARVADVAAQLADTPEHRLPALQVLAASTVREDHLARVESEGSTDLAWRALARRAELGQDVDDAVAALLATDPDPDAWVQALGVKAARPDEATKAEVWAEVWEKRSVPSGTPIAWVGGCFWRPSQEELLRPWRDRYLDEVSGIAGTGMLALMSLLRRMMPPTADDAFIEQATALAGKPDLPPIARSALLGSVDTLRRVQRARG